MRLRFALSALLLTLPTAALAITVTTGEDTLSFVQKRDQFHFGESITLPLSADGDVVMLGQRVTLDEPVAGSAQLAGQTVIINTEIGGNLRAAGETVIVRGTVDGSVLLLGQDITVQEGAVINGDVTAVGENIRINGLVRGSALLRGDNVRVGAIAGEADIRAAEVTLSGVIGQNTVVAGKVSLEPKASIEGDLRYWDPRGEQSLATQVKGGVSFDAALSLEEGNQEGPAQIGLAILGALSGVMVLSAALVLLAAFSFMPKLLADAGKEIVKHPWLGFFTGLLAFVLLPVVGTLLAISVVGLPLALLTLLAFIAFLLLRNVLAAAVIACWLSGRRKKPWSAWATGAVALGIYVVLKLLPLVPGIGLLIGTAIMCVGFGALLQTAWQKLRKTF